MRFIIAALAFFCLIPANALFADLGVLANYRGDWMIGKNRKYLVSTRWNDGGNSLELRYAYSSDFCPRWVRKAWTMSHDASSGTYTAIIKGRTTETATGIWDKSSNTMIWTMEKPPRRDASGVIESQSGQRRILHEFRKGGIDWATKYISPNGTESTSQKMSLSVLVPYRTPEPTKGTDRQQ